jgi:hypothetical protein
MYKTYLYEFFILLFIVVNLQGQTTQGWGSGEIYIASTGIENSSDNVNYRMVKVNNSVVWEGGPLDYENDFAIDYDNSYSPAYCPENITQFITETKKLMLIK